MTLERLYRRRPLLHRHNKFIAGCYIVALPKIFFFSLWNSPQMAFSATICWKFAVDFLQAAAGVMAFPC
ncbi:hypothetical protein KCP78_15700 [Salmonella enterica subsp. enterica]|nr:hypothetical protein KCP78_15700 [Salmonella enterica subsp. enterica]